MRIRHALAAIAAVAGILASGATGYALHHQAPAPAPCSTPAGQLPSGDAGTFGGITKVCTDGTWVTVTGYGS